MWEARAEAKNARDNEMKKQEAQKKFVAQFDKLLIRYPDDVEARLLYFLELPDVSSAPVPAKDSTHFVPAWSLCCKAS